MAHKDAARLLIVHHAHIQRRRVLRVRDVRSHLPRRKSAVRRQKAVTPVVAGQHALPVGRQQHMLRVCRVHIHVVHDHICPGRLHPVLACIIGAIQAFRRPREHRVQVVGVLHQHPGPPRLRRNALGFIHANPASELLSPVHALVDPRARTQVHHQRLRRIHQNRKHVRVFDYSLLDARPVRSPVRGLPGQVPCARVDGIGVRRVHGQRLDLVDLLAVLGADPLPVRPAVHRTEDPFQRPRHQDLRVRRCHSQRADRLSAHLRLAGPRRPAVAADEQPAVWMVAQRIGRRQQMLGVCRVHQYFFYDQIVAVAHPRQPLPAPAAVRRLIDPAVGRP